MKANELMIGDLVYIPKLKKTAYITTIYGDRGEVCTSTGHVSISWIKPITLTMDILKNNGFEYNIHDYCYRCKNHDIGIEIGNDGLYEGGYQDYFYMVYSCEYVHELQHALRLCGLRDLADNLKVE